MATLARVPDAWERARNRFTEDLSEQERYIYYQATPETILYAASASEKRLHQDSKTRWSLDKLKPFVASVEQYGKAMDVFANTYPLVMSPLWGCFRVVLILAQEAGQYFDKIAEMLLKLGEALPRIHIYEDLFSRHERVVQALSTIYCDLLAFCYKAKKVFRKPKRNMFSIAWKSFEKQFGKILEDFESHQKTVEKEVNTSHMIEAAESRDQTRQDQLTRVREQKEHAIWQTLASFSDINYEAQLAKLCGLKRDGTCVWLAVNSVFLSWWEATCSKGLCIRGIPGSGKSVLVAHFVSESLSTPDSHGLVLYHFCDYKESTTLKPESIYRSLLKQAYVYGKMPDQVVEDIVSQSQKSSFGPYEQMSLNMLRSTVAEAGMVSIICDGLDECEPAAQRAICRSLNELLSLQRPGGSIKVLVTCREEERPLMYLMDFSHIRLTPAVLAHDIQRFVHTEVESVIDSGEMRLSDPLLKQEISDRLIREAKGMFLWVDLQIKDICEIATDQGKRNALQDLPKDLEETYRRMACKALEAPDLTQVGIALRLVACAQRPLSTAELQEAVSFSLSDKSWDDKDLPDMDKLLQQCRGLLLRDPDLTVRFAHHTALQFCSSGIARGPELSVQKTIFSMEDAHLCAAQRCVCYLSFTNFESTIAIREERRRADINTVFARGGPIAIPATLGLMPSRFELSRWFARSKMKLPTTDFAQYTFQSRSSVNVASDDEQYAFFRYAKHYWPYHSKIQRYDTDFRISVFADAPELLEDRYSLGFSYAKPDEASNTAGLPIGIVKFFDGFWLRCLVGCSIAAYEFRPWEMTQHYGQYGCKGCPPPENESDKPQNLGAMSALHWAAENNHVPLLIGMSSDLMRYMRHERYSQQTLISACRHGYVDVVRILVHHGAEPADSEAVKAACIGGHLGVLQVLQSRTRERYGLKKGPESEFTQIEMMMYEDLGRCVIGPAGQAVSHCAAEHGQLHIMDYLKQTEQYQNLSDLRKWTPFHYAVNQQQTAIVHWLLKDSPTAKITDQINADGETALQVAARLGYTDIARLLIHAGCDFSTAGHLLSVKLSPRFIAPYQPGELVSLHYRPSALNLAAREGHTDILRLFDTEDFAAIARARGHKALPSHTDALDLAILHGRAETVKFLLCETILSSSAGTSQLLMLAIASDDTSTVRFILNQWPHVAQGDLNGLQPLHLAIFQWKNQALEAIVRHLGPSIDLDARIRRRTGVDFDLHGMNAIHTAVGCGNKKALEILLPLLPLSNTRLIDAPVEIMATNDRQSREFKNALHMSIQYEKWDIMNLLLEFHADILARYTGPGPLTSVLPLTLYLIPDVWFDKTRPQQFYDATLAAWTIESSNHGHSHSGRCTKACLDDEILEHVLKDGDLPRAKQLFDLGVRLEANPRCIDDVPSTILGNAIANMASLSVRSRPDANLRVLRKNPRWVILLQFLLGSLEFSDGNRKMLELLRARPETWKLLRQRGSEQTAKIVEDKLDDWKQRHLQADDTTADQI